MALIEHHTCPALLCESITPSQIQPSSRFDCELNFFYLTPPIHGLATLPPRSGWHSPLLREKDGWCGVQWR